MPGPNLDNGLPVNRLTVVLTDSELAAVLAYWGDLIVVPGAPLLSVKARLAEAGRDSLAQATLNPGGSMP